jgi:hypothetical protein
MEEYSGLTGPVASEPGRKPEGRRRAVETREALSLGEQRSDLQGQFS